MLKLSFVYYRPKTAKRNKKLNFIVIKTVKDILYIAFLSFGFVSMLSAQRVMQPKIVELDRKGVIFKQEEAFQFRIHEQGATVSYYKGKIRTYHKTSFYQFELGFQKDLRERRQNKNYNFAGEGSSRSFTFSKINSVINLRAGIGRKTYLSEKAKRRGIAVGWMYEFGPSVALLKPYHLKLIYLPDDGQPGVEIVSEAYSEENADKFLELDDIYGASPFVEGLGGISLVPGIQAKAGLHFGLGAFDKYMRAVETGIMVDVFTRRIDILVETEERRNSPYFIKLFASFQLGLRSTN